MNKGDPKERMEPFEALIDEWVTEATHPQLGDIVIPGRVRFEWLAGERFLIQRSENDHSDLPDSISVIGVMEGDETLSMQYFDSRGIHRIYQVSFDGTELRTWRDAPGFVQRQVAKLSDDDSTLTSVSQLDENNQGFRDDLAVTYRRSSEEIRQRMWR